MLNQPVIEWLVSGRNFLRSIINFKGKSSQRTDFESLEIFRTKRKEFAFQFGKFWDTFPFLLTPKLTVSIIFNYSLPSSNFLCN